MIKRILLGITFLIMISGCSAFHQTGGQLKGAGVEQITIYQNGQQTVVPSIDPLYEKLLNTTEEAVDSIRTTYKGIRETPAYYTDSVLTLEIKFRPGTKIEVDPSDTKEQQLPAELIVIPLDGNDYHRNQVITIGNSQVLSLFKTSQSDLASLKTLVTDYIQ